MKQAFALIDQLILQGVKHFCIAPGSRSAPLAIRAFSDYRAKVHIHFDERGLGFFALGIAMATKEPVALIVTSGTAVANLFPSVVEAKYQEIPLLILSADRPYELRECGANQTIDQVKIFGSMVKSFYDLGPDVEVAVSRSTAVDAYFSSRSIPQGPVHLNCQFRKPLYREEEALPGEKVPLFFAKRSAPSLTKQKKRGVICLGKGVLDPLPMLSLAKRLKWPVFADLLSNARSFSFEEEIHHFDLLLQDPEIPSPDLLLHFGKGFVSDQLTYWHKEVEKIHIHHSPALIDEARTVSERVVCDVAQFCENFSAETDLSWLTIWKEKESQMKQLLEKHFKEASFVEAKFFHHLSQRLPDNALIFLGNSMPIREAHSFLFPKHPQRFFANRGVSGIDGNIATIAGLHVGFNQPIFAILGDLSALHDLNSLALLSHKEICLMISNNSGGGIFSHLPAQKLPCFEPLFAAKHNWSFEKVAQMFHLNYKKEEKEDFSSLPFGILEWITQREENFAFHQTLKQNAYAQKLLF